MDYVIGLGANLGSRRANLEAAIALLGDAARVTRISPVYESAPIGPPQPWYLNAAVRVETELDAHALLARLLAIEAQLGRTRSPALRWGPRTLDLDILWAEQPVSAALLQVPHARLGERWFALAPLLDVAPELAGQYAAALDVLGGRPAPYGEALALEPRGETNTPQAGTMLATASALDLTDALADAVSALGRALSPACGTSEAQVVRADAPDGEALAAFVRAVLDRTALGFAFARASVTELGREHVAACLLGAESTDARAHATLLAVETSRAGALHRVVIRTGR